MTYEQSLAESRERSRLRKLENDALYEFLNSGGTLTVRYRFTGSREVVERGVDRHRWGTILSTIGRRYLKSGDVAEWPSYEKEGV